MSGSVKMNYFKMAKRPGNQNIRMVISSIEISTTWNLRRLNNKGLYMKEHPTNFQDLSEYGYEDGIKWTKILITT